jgi:hypothetical protein
MPDELAAEKGTGSDAVSTLSNYLAIRDRRTRGRSRLDNQRPKFDFTALFSQFDTILVGRRPTGLSSLNIEFFRPFQPLIYLRNA